MLDRPLKGLRNVKKVLENSVTEFFVLELSRVRSPGIFCSDRKKSWNFLKKIFLEFREKMEFLEFSGPRIFLSWNVLSGNFLSRDFVSRKILAFGKLLHNYLLTMNAPPLQDPKGATFYQLSGMALIISLFVFAIFQNNVSLTCRWQSRLLWYYQVALQPL